MTVTQEVENITNALQHNSDVVGLILAGSVAKQQHNEGSDLDMYIIFKDGTDQDTIELFKQQIRKDAQWARIDISNNALQTLTQFLRYAAINTKFAWDRYNLVHAQVLIDKTDNQLKENLKAKSVLDDRERAHLITSNLGAYINLTYRSIKSHQLHDSESAKLDLSESLVYMLTILFALDNRVRSYNRYLAWELNEHPFRTFNTRDQITYRDIVQVSNGDIAEQLRIYGIIEKLLRRLGYDKFYDTWDNKLKALK